MNPEADLTDLARDGGPVSLVQRAGDDRAQHRIETGLQLLRNRNDLLRHPIDADHCRRHKQAENDRIEPPRAPFNRVCCRQRQHCGERAHKVRSQRRLPVLRPAIAAHKGDGRATSAAIIDRAYDNEQPIAKACSTTKRKGGDADRPGLDDRPRPHRRSDIKAKASAASITSDNATAGMTKRHQIIERLDRAVGKHDLAAPASAAQWGSSSPPAPPAPHPTRHWPCPRP
jgi:hypothetical protein